MVGTICSWQLFFRENGDGELGISNICQVFCYIKTYGSVKAKMGGGRREVGGNKSITRGKIIKNLENEDASQRNAMSY